MESEITETPWLVTNNVKEVNWPPPNHHIKEKQSLDSIKSLPNLSGVVHMGRTRRQMMDLEFENVVKSSSAQYTSHPFTKGGFQPSKIDADTKWSQTVSKVFSPPSDSEQSRPRQVLKNVDSVLTQPVSSRSSYKMPPGTSRTRKCQESYVRETGANFKVKIDDIIATDLKELFGEEEEEVAGRSRHSMMTSSKPRVTALPLNYHEVMISLPDLEANNPYNRLITAIEIVESSME